jgi:hypothetical protein
MSDYFNKLPNINYINRLPGHENLNDYIAVKNLFRRPIIRSDIFENLAYFTKYQIIGDERPDNVAEKVYGNANYDWIVLMCNNVINIQTEWPIPQDSLHDHLIEKYGSESEIYNGIHHYETQEVKDVNGKVILPKGIIVPQDFQFSFYSDGQYFTTTQTSLTSITNYEYEIQQETEKRNIFLIKPNYVSIIVEEAENNLEYKSDSSQYVSSTLKQVEDFRLFT